MQLFFGGGGFKGKRKRIENDTVKVFLSRKRKEVGE